MWVEISYYTSLLVLMCIFIKQFYFYADVQTVRMYYVISELVTNHNDIVVRENFTFENHSINHYDKLTKLSLDSFFECNDLLYSI